MVSDGTPTIVVGLDGANWGLIDPWLKEDKLPNIERLRQSGTDAVSHSELPPVTCPNWKCYSSSKNPGELGVFWWELIDPEDGTISFSDASSFETAEIWDYLGADGKKWLCLNMPTTYPPRDILGGRVVAGGPLCADSDFTVDSDFEQKLKKEFGYKVRPEIALTSSEDSEEEVNAILSLIELRFDVLEWYLDEYDPEFAHITIFLLNILQHYFWNGDPAREAWELIDERIGDIEDRTRNLVLMSDHGCSPVDTIFHVNRWLQQEGYLTTETGLTVYLSKLGVTKETVSNAVETLGIRRFARKLPRSVKNVFPQEDEGAKREAKANMIDWESSLAVASGQGPLYVKEDGNEALSAEIAEKIEKLETPNGRPVSSTVYTREQAYSGQFMERAPELIIEQGEGVHISDGVGIEDVFNAPSRWSADNDRDGLFLAVGEDISTGRIDRISIKDIAPTVLHLMNVPIPRDMEGDVLDIFADDRPDVEYREPIHITEERRGTEDAVEERLEDLGYIGQ